MGENLNVVWAVFSTISKAVSMMYLYSSRDLGIYDKVPSGSSQSKGRDFKLSLG